MTAALQKGWIVFFVFIILVGMITYFQKGDIDSINYNKTRISQFSSLVDMYKVDYKVLPATLVQVEPYLSKKFSQQVDQNIFLDEWGSEFVYKVSDGDEYIVYSIGLNKVDDSCSQDDVCL